MEFLVPFFGNLRDIGFPSILHTHLDPIYHGLIEFTTRGLGVDSEFFGEIDTGGFKSHTILSNVGTRTSPFIRPRKDFLEVFQRDPGCDVITNQDFVWDGWKMRVLVASFSKTNLDLRGTGVKGII